MLSFLKQTPSQSDQSVLLAARVLEMAGIHGKLAWVHLPRSRRILVVEIEEGPLDLRLLRIAETFTKEALRHRKLPLTGILWRYARKPGTVQDWEAEFAMPGDIVVDELDFSAYEAALAAFAENRKGT